MGAEATLKLILLGDDRSASKALRGTAKDADHTSSRFGALGRNAGKALTGGLLIAGAAAVKFAKNAAADETAARRLEIALQNTTGATKDQVDGVEDWISAQGRALGISDDQLRPALSKLVTATHDVSKAQKLASLAMDISAGTGKDLQTVSMALAKAQNGNVASLGRLGLKVKDADGKVKSLNEVTKDLAQTYKGQASAAANSVEGKQQRLNVALDEAGETIGYKVLPAMLKLTNAGLAMIDWMGKHKAIVVPLVAVLGTLAAVVVAITTAAKVYTAVQTALNIVLAANPIGLVVIAIAALVVGLVVAYKKSETFRNIVDGTFKVIAASAKFMWEKGIRPVLKTWMTVWFTVVGALVNGAAKAFGWVPGIGGKLKKAAQKFNEFRDTTVAALDAVGKKKVRPKVDTSSIDHAISRTRELRGLWLAMPSAPTSGAGGLRTALDPLNITGRKAIGGLVNTAGLYQTSELGSEKIYLPRGAVVQSNLAGQHAAAQYGAEGAPTKVEINFNGVVGDPRKAAQMILGVLRENGVTTGSIALA